MINVTMPSLQFWVPGNPIPKQSFRYKKGGGYQPTRVREWQYNVGYVARGVSPEITPLDRDLKVELNFKRNNKRKCDLDNLSKAVLDACNGIVWEDDRQIVDLRITKVYDKDNPGVLVSIW